MPVNEEIKKAAGVSGRLYAHFFDFAFSAGSVAGFSSCVGAGFTSIFLAAGAAGSFAPSWKVCFAGWAAGAGAFFSVAVPAGLEEAVSAAGASMPVEVLRSSATCAGVGVGRSLASWAVAGKVNP